jgi:signal transduction histidine kinase
MTQSAFRSHQSYARRAQPADPPKVTRAQQILANILRDDQRASKIISHLRGLLKKRDESEMQEFDLNDVISDMVEIVGPEAVKKGVDLSVYNAHGALQVRGDRIQLQQVIMNLAMNVIDAMQGCDPGQGKMSIKTSLTNDSAIEGFGRRLGAVFLRTD